MESREAEIYQRFRALLDVAPEERAGRLAALRASDPELAGEVERLLQHAQHADTAFEDSLRGAAGAALRDAAGEPEAVVLAPGTRLGPWQVIEHAGEGGLGTVYRAARADGAFDMEAAIKLIRFDDPRLRERLDAERRLLALLDHPGIARLIDGGVSDQGQAYLVMEWVAGVDLARARPSGEACLDAFVQVAEAAAHAHQRLVVHGDIKPANIRIMADGRARLVDFGVARLLEDEAAPHASAAHGLTPAFAAPEQLAGRPATTQTDIWALGALLYWLLTGEQPERNQPVRPADLALPRAHELAAILDRAMAPEPAERYATVDALCEDVQRLRTWLPVRAAPAGAARRLALWSRRHRLSATLATVAVLSTVIGVAAVVWQGRIAMAERDLARFEAQRFETVRDRLVALFAEVAAETDEPSARELLDGSARRVQDAPMVSGGEDAELLVVLGEIYIALQDYPSARHLLESVAEGETPAFVRARALAGLSAVMIRQGDMEAALQRADAALALLDGLPGDLRLRYSEAYQHRALALTMLGRWPEAIAAGETALELAQSLDEASHLLARAENGLAATLHYAGQRREAVTLYRQALDTYRAIGAEASSDAVVVMSNLAMLLHQDGLNLEAEPLYEEAVERRHRFGESDAMASLYGGYGQLLALRHRLEAGRRYQERALALHERFAGRISPNYALTLFGLAGVDVQEGDYDGADARLAEAETILQELLGPDHMFTVIARARRGLLVRLRDPDVAVPVLLKMVDELRAAGPSLDGFLAGAYCELATLHLDQGRPAEAVAAARQCLELRQGVLPPESWMLVEAQAIVAACELAAGDAEAHARMDVATDELARALSEEDRRVVWLRQDAAPP